MPRTKTKKKSFVEPLFSLVKTPTNPDKFLGISTKSNPTSDEVGRFEENEEDYIEFGDFGCTIACSFDISQVPINVWVDKRPDEADLVSDLFQEGEVSTADGLFIFGLGGSTEVEAELSGNKVKFLVYGTNQNDDGFTSINLVIETLDLESEDLVDEQIESEETEEDDEQTATKVAPSDYSYKSPSSMEVLEKLTDMLDTTNGDDLVMPYGYPFEVEMVKQDLFPEGGLTESNLIKVLYEDEREVAPFDLEVLDASTPYSEGAIQFFEGITEKFRWNQEIGEVSLRIETRAPKWRELRDYLYDHLGNLNYVVANYTEVQPASEFTYFDGKFNSSGKGVISLYDNDTASPIDEVEGKSLFTSSAFGIKNCLEDIPVKVVSGETIPSNFSLLDRGRIKIGQRGLILSGTETHHLAIPSGKADVHVYGTEKRGKIVKLSIAINRLIPAKSLEEQEETELILAGQLMNINISKGELVEPPSLGDWFFLRSRAD